MCVVPRHSMLIISADIPTYIVFFLLLITGSKTWSEEEQLAKSTPCAVLGGEETDYNVGNICLQEECIFNIAPFFFLFFFSPSHLT